MDLKEVKERMQNGKLYFPCLLYTSLLYGEIHFQGGGVFLVSICAYSSKPLMKASVSISE